MQLKAYAKLNLTLDVLKKTGGYHMLDSLVTTVDLCDDIDLRPRDDGLCTVKMRGLDIPPEKNNALLAAQAFCRRFSTRGVDLFIEKHIPLGAGMGGSSADPAAVIAGMGRLYSVNDRAALKKLADAFGSDTGYLLEGGIARIGGRGDRVTRLPFQTMYFAVVFVATISTGACFAAYDACGESGGSRTAQAAALLARGDVAGAAARFGNDLTHAAQAFADVEGALGAMRVCSPLGAGMTGSGGGVFGAFQTQQEAAAAKKKLEGLGATYCLKSIEY